MTVTRSVGFVVEKWTRLELARETRLLRSFPGLGLIGPAANGRVAGNNLIFFSEVNKAQNLPNTICIHKI